MLRHSLRTLAVAAVAAFILGPAPAAAVTPVSACQPLNKAGETYVLTADITASSDCFLIQADRITLDLAGKTITGSGSIGVGVGFVGNFTLTVVKNGSIVNFFVGIFLPGPRNTVRGVTASDNGGGMLIGPSSLVKDCVVQRNGNNGIITGDGVQVENCLIGGDDNNGNGQFGLAGGHRMLVTKNTVIGNGDSGILVGMNSTVTHNTANDNSGDGIAVGQKSLVTLNTANDNADNGIEAVCPSTVTNNQASDNGDLDFNFIGAGCFDKGNTSPDNDPV
jgi:hypothetical protein